MSTSKDNYSAKSPPRPQKPPRQTIITSRQHQDDLRVLKKASPEELAQAVVQGFGVKRVRR